MKPRIQTRLTLLATLLTLIVGSAATTYSLIIKKESLLSDFEAQSIYNASVITGGLANDLFLLKGASIRESLIEIRHLYPAILFSFVADAQGLIITDATRENPMRGQTIKDPRTEDLLRTSEITAWREENMVKVGGPVTAPDGLIVGYIFLGYSTSEPMKALTDFIKDILLVTTLLFLLGFILAHLFARSFNKPIKALMLAAQKLSRGEWDMTLPVTSDDEIGELARAFNAMAREVQETRSGLEQKVKERTQALEDLQEKLVASQKMEVIGRLTGGVAHDFNNLLGIIMGNCELALEELKPGDPLKENLTDIKEASEHGATLTRQLLAFSRQQPLKPIVFSLNGILHQANRLLQRLIGKNIQLLTIPTPGLGLVYADPHQMEQVILNLAANARDAMPYGGKLTLETKNTALDAEYTKHYPDLREGPHVMLSVSDTGKGISKGHLPRIFEPFFTTKGMGKGIGLGLSIVYGIVKQSKGHIAVYSEEGKGTALKIYLPRVEAGALVKEEPGEKPAHVSLKGTETILVLEDEKKLRKIVCKILRDKGYTVLDAATGKDALEKSASHTEPIALLITDVIMPDMSGPEIAAQITAKKPGTKVLYISGFTEDAIVHHGVLDEGTNFLAKPFTPEELLQQVRHVLGTPKNT